MKNIVMNSILISVGFAAICTEVFAMPAFVTEPVVNRHRTMTGQGVVSGGTEGTKVECVDTEGGFNIVNRIARNQQRDRTAQVSLPQSKTEAFLYGLAMTNPTAVIKVNEYSPSQKKFVPVDYFDCKKVTTANAQQLFENHPQFDPLNANYKCPDRNRQFQDLAVISGIWVRML